MKEKNRRENIAILSENNNRRVVLEKKVVNLIRKIKIKVFYIQKCIRIMNRK